MPEHGFELLREDYIAENKTTARMYRHVKTGAEVLSLVNDDENKVFGITFRTPPSDSTGLPHILEHSVLCGSRKYPVKEPFVELLKGSLQTFLNAFTYPDKTCYPVASANLQDFYNLVDVYLDAVFFPRLTPYVFMQEGWHLEPASPDAGDGEFSIKGVVYNEMKGSYSSPERALAEYSQQCVFPDSVYGVDSGGDPAVIPDLTFEAFMDFHRRYYHPSNARIWFYGDDDADKRLEILSAYLDQFERSEPGSEIALQPFFDKPRQERRGYACAEPVDFDEAEEGDEEGEAPACGEKSMVTVNWLLPEATDAELNFSFDILEYILIGMPASPLRKALIDSGLGEDLAGSGWEGEIRQMFFSTGLKGVEPENVEKVEPLILKTLEDLARDGVSAEMVEAAVNTVEFSLRENNTGSFPRGLSLMLRSLSTWLYGGDPLCLVRFEEPLGRIKERLAKGERVFEELIRRWFLDNAHRVALILEPDPALGKRREEEERALVATRTGGLSEAERAAVAKDAAKLAELQRASDAPEALATIPRLHLADLPRQNKTIPLDLSELGGIKTLFHDLDTTSIVYLDVGMDLRCLPLEYLPCAPLFGRALLEIGTDKEDYVSLTQRIARKTGGIRPDSLTSSLKSGPGSAAWLFLRGKSTLENADELLDILEDVLLAPRLSDRERFRQMVLEEKAREEQRIVPSGHHVVSARLRARFSEADYAAEQMHGVSSLFWLRRLAETVDKDWPRIESVLEDLRSSLVRRGNMILNVTLDAKSYESLKPRLQAFAERMPAGVSEPRSWRVQPLPPLEGLTIPAQVKYVGKGLNLFDAGYAFHGSALAVTRLLRTSYLWDKVRVQGGAYGAFGSLDRLSGAFAFVSYRDPNLVETLRIYDRAADFLRSGELGVEELEKSVIGAVGDLDAYMLPDAKGYVSMLRWLIGDTDEERQAMREELLSASRSDFERFGEALSAVADKGQVVALGPRDALEAAAAGELKGLAVTRVL